MRHFILLCLLATFSVATVAAPRKPITSFKKLRQDETVVVGRVEMVPAFGEYGQRLRGPMSGKFENKIFMMAEPEYYELTEEPGMGEFKGRIDATFGEEFHVKSSNQPFYFIAGMFYLSLGQGSMPEIAYFPGGFKVDIRPTDKAIYIGTLRYHRNEFFEVTNIEVIDEYERVKAEFVHQFGTEHELRKALMTSVE